MAKGIKAGDAFWDVGADHSKLNKNLKEAATEVKGAGDKMERSFSGAAVAAAAMGTAAIAALAVSTKQALSFSEGMAEIATLGVKDLEAMGETVKNLSADFGIELPDSIAATYQALSAGAAEDNIGEFLKTAARAAKAGTASLQEAVELGAGIANSFGKDFSEVGPILDEAFVAVADGVTTLAELAAGAGKVSPQIAALGLESKELFAATTALSKAGIKTSEGFTYMKAVMMGVLKPTSQATAAAKEMKLEFSAAALESKGLAGFIDSVKEATGGSAEKMGELFGSGEALTAMLALTGNQADDFAGALQRMTDETGAAVNAFGIFRDENDKLAFDKLIQELNVLSLEIGQALVPALKAVVEFLIPIVRGMRDWVHENPKLATTITVTTAAISALAVAMTGLKFIGIARGISKLVGKAGAATGTGAATKGAGLLGLKTAALAAGKGIAGVAASAAAVPFALAAAGVAVLTWTYSVKTSADAELQLQQAAAASQNAIAMRIIAMKEAGYEIERNTILTLDYATAVQELNNIELRASANRIAAAENERLRVEGVRIALENADRANLEYLRNNEVALSQAAASAAEVVMTVGGREFTQAEIASAGATGLTNIDNSATAAARRATAATQADSTSGDSAKSATGGTTVIVQGDAIDPERIAQKILDATRSENFRTGGLNPAYA